MEVEKVIGLIILGWLIGAVLLMAGLVRRGRKLMTVLATRYPETYEALRTNPVILLIPAAYLFYSVKRYFGFKRAFGIDHFDNGYRSMPFEHRGIFRFTRNGMYIYGFLLLWVPAFWWASLAALSVAVFNHLYIWVHYFATELPDIKRIYSETRTQDYNETA